MKKQEAIEMALFCAKNVMGYKLADVSVGCTEKQEVLCRIDFDGKIIVSTPFKIKVASSLWFHQWRKYDPATNPKDATDVWKACCKMVDQIHIVNSANGDFAINALGSEHCFLATGKTWEIAVCNFAKKVFSK